MNRFYNTGQGPGNGGNGNKQIINKDDDITNTQEQQEIDEGLREDEARRKEEAIQKKEDYKPETEQPLNKPAETGNKIPDLNTGPKPEEK